jgi:hypothetical protein
MQYSNNYQQKIISACDQGALMPTFSTATEYKIPNDINKFHVNKGVGKGNPIIREHAQDII